MQPKPKKQQLQELRMTKRIGPYVSGSSGIVQSKDRAVKKAFKQEVKSAIKTVKRGGTAKPVANLRDRKTLYK